MDVLRQLVAEQRRCFIQPRSFFIAWCGVPMLTYNGFPNAILDLKNQIETHIPRLTEENPGSKWPGTTLGALREGHLLSFEELRILRQICTDFEPEIRAMQAVFAINELQYILFGCRSLERRLLTTPLPLHHGRYDTSDLPRKHKNWVQHIHAQFDENRLADYLPAVQQPGHHISHYRNTHVEGTLVFDLPPEQPDYIERFIEAVNRALPDRYTWFEPSARDITIRALAFK